MTLPYDKDVVTRPSVTPKIDPSLSNSPHASACITLMIQPINLAIRRCESLGFHLKRRIDTRVGVDGESQSTGRRVSVGLGAAFLPSMTLPVLVIRGGLSKTTTFTFL